MKLVDILARELKVWPPHIKCLWVARGNTIYGKDGAHEHEMNGSWPIPEDHSIAIVSPHEWQAAVDALKAGENIDNAMSYVESNLGDFRYGSSRAEELLAWNGEGSPPVGAVCEFEMALAGWIPVTVTAITERSIVFTRPRFNERTGLDHANLHEEIIALGALNRFRPIRTPEQIAKQERSRACDKMYGVILDKVPQDRRNNGRDICEALYDAGYRKFEIVDN